MRMRRRAGGRRAAAAVAARVVQLASVLLEVEVAAEALAARAARERLPVLVRMHVKRQVVDLVESFRADLYTHDGTEQNITVSC